MILCKREGGRKHQPGQAWAQRAAPLQKQSATADKVVQEKKRKRGATKTDG
jgi:hypothetical protein